MLINKILIRSERHKFCFLISLYFVTNNFILCEIKIIFNYLIQTITYNTDRGNGIKGNGWTVLVKI